MAVFQKDSFKKPGHFPGPEPGNPLIPCDQWVAVNENGVGWGFFNPYGGLKGFQRVVDDRGT